MKKNSLTKLVIAVLMLTLVLGALSGCGAKEVAAPTPAPTPTPAPAPEQPTDVEEENQAELDAIAPYLEERAALEPTPMPKVEIKMPEYEMAYSGEMKDVILTETLSDANGIKFSVKLSESEAHIFTMLYNTNQGELVTVLTDAKGERVPVAFLMPNIPEGLSAEDEFLFYTAQESVNDIVSSLVLK